MSAEYVADLILDLVSEHDAESETDDYTDENVRSGGYWFTLTRRGRHYEVEVTEVTQR